MLFKKILPVGCHHGILYGQARVCKPVINNCLSFRPILDTISTPLYKLAYFFVPILYPLASNKCSIKVSFPFPKEITKTDCSYVMANLDIESFFTNIPLGHVKLIFCLA